MASPPIHTLSLPSYVVGQAADWGRLGETIDRFLEAHFRPGRLAIRGLSLQDHPGLTLEALAAKILELGTDRYDLARKGVLHDFYASYRIDLHALPCELSAGRLSSPNCQGSVMADVLADFYHGPPQDRGGPPLRLDLLTVYDRDKLEAVAVDYGTVSGDAPCEFRFLEADKRAALLGLVLIL